MNPNTILVFEQKSSTFTITNHSINYEIPHLALSILERASMTTYISSPCLFILFCQNQSTLKKMKKNIGIAFLLALTFSLLSIPYEAMATHFMGGQITYSHVSGNTYKIRLSLYRDCDGISYGSSEVIRISPTNSGSSMSVSRIAINDVSLLCPGQVSNCAGGAAPGIQEYVYEGNISLNTPGLYTFSHESCCRNTDITTITNPGNTGWYISAQINTNLAPGNSSPSFLNLPVDKFCIGSLNSISPNAFDANGDVIQYSLVPAQDNSTTLVSYAAGFSGTNPLTSSTPITINPNTGELSFTPSSASNQVAVIAIKAEEFRVINGVSTKIGEVIRELQVSFVNCSGNSAPVLSAISNVIVPVGQNSSTTVSATDDPSQSLTLTAVSSIIPPATFTITGSESRF